MGFHRRQFIFMNFTNDFFTIYVNLEFLYSFASLFLINIKEIKCYHLLLLILQLLNVEQQVLPFTQMYFLSNKTPSASSPLFKYPQTSNFLHFYLLLPILTTSTALQGETSNRFSFPKHTTKIPWKFLTTQKPSLLFFPLKIEPRNNT